jgi:2'-5' RNA ligase
MMSNNNLRLFVAVPLWDQFRLDALPKYDQLRRLHLPLRWVQPLNWHLTMLFLGDVPAAAVNRIAEHLRNLPEEKPVCETSQLKPFEIELGQLGAFPRLSKARVVWVGVRTGRDELVSLADRIRIACEVAGFPGDKKPFQAHLTLGRAKDQPVTVQIPSAWMNESWGSHWVDSFCLVRSQLQQGGSVYEVLVRFPLPSQAGSSNNNPG